MLFYPMKRVSLTAGFGSYAPFGRKAMHYGIDLAAQSADEVLAAHAGTVLFSLYDAAGGNMVALRGDYNGALDVITRYAHLASRAVQAGQPVAAGQRIGRQGATGSACTGKHLHFECWLVPKDYIYRAAGRERYAVDPLSVCHADAGCSFVCDEKTKDFRAIPSPEAIPEDLEAVDGTLVLTGGVEAFTVPDNSTAPITAGENGARRYITHFLERTSYPARFRCSGADAANPGGRVLWAAADTGWGLVWLPLLEGRSRLVLRQANGGEAACPETVRNGQSGIDTDGQAEGQEKPNELSTEAAQRRHKLETLLTEALALCGQMK